MSERLSIAVIGAGYWGPNLIRNVHSNERARLAAVCDLSSDARARIARAYPGVVTTDSIAEALSLCDAAVVSTPVKLHYEHALLALKAGKHVLVEKPLATSPNEAAELLTTAVSRNRALMVGHTFLHNSVIRYVKTRIESGDLGKVMYLYGSRLNLGQVRRDVDVVWNLAPHDVSIANYWLADRPSHVSARGLCYLQPDAGLSDVAFCQFDYPSGQTAHFHLSWLDPKKTRETVVVGDQKMLVFDDVNPDAYVRILEKRVERESPLNPGDFADFRMRVRSGDMVIPSVRYVEPLAAEIDAFVSFCLDGKVPLTDGRNGLEVVCVLEALSRSMDLKGSIVPVRYPEEAQW